MVLYDSNNTPIFSRQINAEDGRVSEAVLTAPIDSTAAQTYQLAVYRDPADTSGLPVGRFEVQLTGGPPNSVSPGGTVNDALATQGGGDIHGQPLVPGINTVGAINWTNSAAYGQTPDFPEAFSSKGTGQLLFAQDGTRYATPVDAGKPSFLAPDGVITSVPGFAPFFGTSAAAPDAAGVAALMLQAAPGLGTAQITRLLQLSAQDTGTSPAYEGVGAIRADRAVLYAASTTTNAGIDVPYYLTANPDVTAAGVDPANHFLLTGWTEGRNPSASFSTSLYLAGYPDVKAAGIDPLIHYQQFGQAEGRLTFAVSGVPGVDAAFYRATYSDVAAAGVDPSLHYLTYGWTEGRNPDAFFDTGYYLSHNPDVAAAHLDPLLHYEQFGWKEGRDPSAQVSTSKYLAAYADVRAAGVDPLIHYLDYGRYEGRTAFPV